jgi:hypothetical protein
MPSPTSDNLWLQVAWLLILAVPVACIAWTVTHEEIFREPREWAQRQCDTGRSFLYRKFCYIVTCEYCFSHYVAIAFIALTQFRLLLDDWRGYVISLFALVWLANAYMSAFQRLRVDIRRERAEARLKEQVAPSEAELESAKREEASRNNGAGASRKRAARSRV